MTNPAAPPRPATVRRAPFPSALPLLVLAAALAACQPARHAASVAVRPAAEPVAAGVRYVGDEYAEREHALLALPAEATADTF